MCNTESRGPANCGSPAFKGGLMQNAIYVFYLLDVRHFSGSASKAFLHPGAQT